MNENQQGWFFRRLLVNKAARYSWNGLRFGGLALLSAGVLGGLLKPIEPLYQIVVAVAAVAMGVFSVSFFVFLLILFGNYLRAAMGYGGTPERFFGERKKLSPKYWIWVAALAAVYLFGVFLQAMS